MAMLILGLVLFIGAHVTPTFPAFRSRWVERLGVGPYKLVFTAASLAGLILIVLGVSATRDTWSVFTNTSFAFEFQDIGLNSNTNLRSATSQASVYGHGSLFRSLHLGAETNWKVIALMSRNIETVSIPDAQVPSPLRGL